MPTSKRQSNASVPACRRLLFDVEPARADAASFRWRVAQFDTLRLRLIKLAVRIDVLKTKVRLHLPWATPDQALFALLLERMPRLSI